VIDEETDRLNRFIEGLSSADRPDASQPLSLAASSLEAIVRDALTRAETITSRHRLDVSIEPGLPSLSVDPAAVREVIYILLDNASKYSVVGTTIRLIAHREEDDRRVHLSVADEGPGIPPELREKVFERFFRIPGREPVDPGRTGGGLGLPIARRLVEAQAGSLWVEGRDGARGTTVIMTLPIEIGAPQPGAHATITAAAVQTAQA
jgi:signal transduction histidine kinase